MSVGPIRHPRAVPLEEIVPGTVFILVRTKPSPAREEVVITAVRDEGDGMEIFYSLGNERCRIFATDACAEEYSGEDWPDGGWNQWNRFETRHHEDCTARHPADQFCRDAYGATLPDEEGL